MSSLDHPEVLQLTGGLWPLVRAAPCLQPGTVIAPAAARAPGRCTTGKLILDVPA